MDEPFDPSRTTAFARRLGCVMEHAMLGLMTELGHRAGLFETLASMPAGTSEQIARAARLDERYVREWLGAMASARVVEYDGTRRTFRLPREHAAVLASSGADAVVPRLSWIGALANAEPALLDAMRGRAVDPGTLEGLRVTQRRERDRVHIELLESDLVPLVPGLRDRLRAGAEVLDFAGSGRIASEIARAYPRSRVTSAAAPGQRFDLVTCFDVLHEQPDPEHAARDLSACLVAGGTLVATVLAASSHLSDNLDRPLAVSHYAMSTAVAIPAARAGGGDPPGAMWGHDAARAVLLRAGFDDVRVERLASDPLRVALVAS